MKNKGSDSSRINNDRMRTIQSYDNKIEECRKKSTCQIFRRTNTVQNNAFGFKILGSQGRTTNRNLCETSKSNMHSTNTLD